MDNLASLLVEEHLFNGHILGDDLRLQDDDDLMVVLITKVHVVICPV